MLLSMLPPTAGPEAVPPAVAVAAGALVVGASAPDVDAAAPGPMGGVLPGADAAGARCCRAEARRCLPPCRPVPAV